MKTELGLQLMDPWDMGREARLKSAGRTQGFRFHRFCEEVLKTFSVFSYILTFVENLENRDRQKE